MSGQANEEGMREGQVTCSVTSSPPLTSVVGLSFPLTPDSPGSPQSSHRRLLNFTLHFSRSQPSSSFGKTQVSVSGQVFS